MLSDNMSSFFPSLSRSDRSSYTLNLLHVTILLLLSDHLFLSFPARKSHIIPPSLSFIPYLCSAGASSLLSPASAAYDFAQRGLRGTYVRTVSDCTCDSVVISFFSHPFLSLSSFSSISSLLFFSPLPLISCILYHSIILHVKIQRYCTYSIYILC